MARSDKKTKTIALERITILLSTADHIYSKQPNLAKRYGERARKIAMKARLRMPRQWRHRFCKKCKTFLYPGINTHTRVKAGKPSRVIMYCEECKEGFNAISY